MMVQHAGPSKRMQFSSFLQLQRKQRECPRQQSAGILAGDLLHAAGDHPQLSLRLRQHGHQRIVLPII